MTLSKVYFSPPRCYNILRKSRISAEVNMKVLRKQANSKSCIICGMDNPLGVKAPFYEMEDDSVVTLFSFRSEHQSYPGRAHGGMITCMLDELIGRVIWCFEPDKLAVTLDINVKFRKPVPYGAPLVGVGRIVKNSSRAYVGEAKICDMSGAVLAEGKATYYKMPAAAITDANMHEELDVFVPDDVKSIELPNIE